MFLRSFFFLLSACLWGGKQAREIVKSNRQALKSSRRSFLHHDRRMRHVECEYSLKRKDGDVVKLFGHLYFDPERHEVSAARVESSVLELAYKASTLDFANGIEARGWLAENGGWLARFFSVRNEDGEWRITRKPNAIARAMNNFGMTLIITTESGQEPEETLDDYRCRDIAEKMFDIAKNGVGGGEGFVAAGITTPTADFSSLSCQ